MMKESAEALQENNKSGGKKLNLKTPKKKRKKKEKEKEMQYIAKS